MLLKRHVWLSRALPMLHLPQVWLFRVLLMLHLLQVWLSRVLPMVPQQLWRSRSLHKL